MDKLALFDLYTLKTFCDNYHIEKSDLNQNIHYFRYFCTKMNVFMKNIVLPKFKKESLYEAVIVEFREFPHLEFIIRNNIHKLGANWSHTVICGTNNYDMIQRICSDISTNIQIIQLNIANMTQSEYSHFLMTTDFWNLLKGNKILIYQEDSLIFKSNIDDFMDYDYIGAPFLQNKNDTPNGVGNGGLSLRTKPIMLDIINKFPYTTCTFNTSTLEYMNIMQLQYPPEDVYFSKCMQENRIGIVAEWEVASEFSSESVYNRNSFAGHKFWISNPNWKQKLKKIYNFGKYPGKSDLNKYLKYLKKNTSYNKNKENENAFDIDFYFFCKTNNFDYNPTNSIAICKYFKNMGMNGFIYHPKQLRNIFSNVTLHTFMNNLYISSSLTIHPIPIQNFTNKYLYNSTFEFYHSLFITKKYSCLNNNYDILFLVFIGNEQTGIDLITNIIQHKKINPHFNIAFCFNSNQITNYSKLLNLIKEHFDYYAIYKSKEMGTDITPTLLMYYEINKTHEFKHIYKFHTKSISKNFQELTSYLLESSLDTLLQKKNYMCNCIGNPKHYLSINADIYNNQLKNNYISKINVYGDFVAGTIFYADDAVFKKVIDFIQTHNYRSYFLNNLYENNSINQDFSPIHFLERLFGIIKM